MYVTEYTNPSFAILVLHSLLLYRTFSLLRIELLSIIRFVLKPNALISITKLNEIFQKFHTSIICRQYSSFAQLFWNYLQYPLSLHAFFIVNKKKKIVTAKQTHTRFFLSLTFLCRWAKIYRLLLKKIYFLCFTFCCVSRLFYHWS